MSEKLSSTATAERPWSEVGGPGDWSEEADAQRRRNNEARGLTGPVEVDEQADQIRDLAQRAETWENPVSASVSRPEVETHPESPKRKGILQRLSAGVTRRLVSKSRQASQEPFERHQGGW